jgi:lysophospholipase L1-like esterase
MVVSTPSLAYPAQVAAAMECDFHNIAVGGAIMQEDVARLALDLDWNKAFVAFGINDFAQNRILEDFEKATAKTLEVLVSREGAEVFVITPIPWADRTDPNEIGIYVENYREIIRKVADGMDRVTIIEGSKLVPDDPEMYVDNIHPNDKGMSLYAENLIKELNR